MPRKKLTEHERAELVKEYMRLHPGSTATDIARGVRGSYADNAASLRRLVALGRVSQVRDQRTNTVRLYAKSEPTR